MHFVDADRLRRQRRQDRRVESAGDEHADRNVGHDLLLDRALDEPLRFAHRVVRAARDRRERLRLPVAHQLFASVEPDVRAGRHAAHRGEHRPRLGHVAEAQIFGDGDVVEVARHRRMLQNALQLRREDDLTVRRARRTAASRPRGRARGSAFPCDGPGSPDRTCRRASRSLRRRDRGRAG